MSQKPINHFSGIKGGFKKGYKVILIFMWNLVKERKDIEGVQRSIKEGYHFTFLIMI
jgi:hypothetical protein